MTTNYKTITEEEYEELIENSQFLEALEIAGVDNWDGYDEAREIYRDLVKENK